MKTISQKLASATKKLKQASKLNKALNYRLNGLSSEVDFNKKMLKTAQMYLAYLAARLCGHDEITEDEYEVKIDMAKLINFQQGYDTVSKMNEEYETITLRIFRKPLEKEGADI